MKTALRRGPFAGDHGRARELAALRLDERLSDADDRWLARHLAGCPECVAVAISYADDRDLFRSMRAAVPEPPRDLWARTAAAIEAEPGGRAGSAARRRRGRPAPVGGWTALAFVPVVALGFVVVAVGSGLLNTASPAPGGEIAAVVTPGPIALRNVQVVGQGQGGGFEIQSCQVDADSCLVEPTVETAPLMALDGSDPMGAILSPDQDRIVLMQTGDGATGVYLVPVARPASAASAPPETPAPTAPGPTAPSATPVVTEEPSSSPAETIPAASASPDDASASPSAAPVEQPSASVDPSASPEEGPTATPAPEETASPADEPPATPEPTATREPTSKPAPTPTIEVTPLPGGAIEIARDVVVVGPSAAYDAKGKRFAFSARPANGSAGPDVYVWSTGDALARAVTTDHGSVFAGWQGGDVLVSRVVKGKPGTFLVETSGDDPAGERVSDAWRPDVSPDGKAATWWDGDVVLASDGVTWVPGNGRLVLGPWGGGNGGVQVLADGQIRDWESHWDPDGTVLGVWLAGDKARDPGHLSLYHIDDQGGRAHLAGTVIQNESAFGGFDLEAGRLAFPAPGADRKRIIRVLTWSGGEPVWSELPASAGTTVVRRS